MLEGLNAAAVTGFRKAPTFAETTAEFVELTTERWCLTLGEGSTLADVLYTAILARLLADV